MGKAVNMGYVVFLCMVAALGGMIACLLMIGMYFATGSMPTWFLLVFFLLYVFCTAISISAVVFVLLSEMYPNRVRGLAMSVAGLALWVGI